MTTKQAEALATIRAAGTVGVDAWTMQDGKRVRTFAPGTIAALILADLVEIGQDSRRPVCATYCRAKAR